jgi:hypothetical protein
MSIIHTLDEIGQTIEKITNSDVRQEAKYDFENASEHIVEWSRHNLRAAGQDVEKKLSVHSIGLKKSCRKSTANRKVNITEKTACWFSSDHSYGKTTGRHSLDSLSAAEIITKQFNADHPHVKKLHKRTDNATNFSSHSTPEVEKLICQRVRFLF